MDGEPLGHAATETLEAYVGNTGAAIGKLDLEEGIVRTQTGKQIGIPGSSAWVPGINGTVTDFSGEPIGTFDDLGLVRGHGGSVFGHVCPDGAVMTILGEVVGIAPIKAGMQIIGAAASDDMATNVVMDETGQVIGITHTDGTVLGQGGVVVGKVDEFGLVRRLSGTQVGTVQQRPSIYSRPASAERGKNNPPPEAGIDATEQINEEGGLTSPVSRPGPTLVRDSEGNVVGVVADNGLVLDQAGEIIGSIVADGSVIDKNGECIGKADKQCTQYEEGKPGLVYGRDGAAMGIIGVDGAVRDKQGEVIAMVDTNGNVVDLQGTVIGTAVAAERYQHGSVAVACAVKGCIIGTVDESSQVRDHAGTVIGRAEADGVLVGPDEHLLGHALVVAPAYRPGSPGVVKDAQGKVVGIIGNDGVARSLNGRQLGKVVANGVVLSDEGKAIGQGISVLHHTPGEIGVACNEQGFVIGAVGSNGNVSGDDGCHIGQVGAGGQIVNDQGQAFGVAGAALPYTTGTLGLVYDDSGKRVGLIGEDGVARTDDGEILGSVTKDGRVVDAQGRTYGRATAADDWLPGTIGFVLPSSDDGPVDVSRVSKDGQVLDRKGQQIGYVNSSGMAVNIVGDQLGRPISNMSARRLEGAPAPSNNFSEGNTTNVVVLPRAPAGAFPSIPAPETILQPSSLSRSSSKEPDPKVIRRISSRQKSSRPTSPKPFEQTAPLSRMSSTSFRDEPSASGRSGRLSKRTSSIPRDNQVEAALHAPPRRQSSSVSTKSWNSSAKQSTTEIPELPELPEVTEVPELHEVSELHEVPEYPPPPQPSAAGQLAGRSPKAGRQAHSSSPTLDAPAGLVPHRYSLHNQDAALGPKLSLEAEQRQSISIYGGFRGHHPTDQIHGAKIKDKDRSRTDQQGYEFDGTQRVVRDAVGSVLGFLFEDGTVRSTEGNLLGSLTADGTLVDTSGKVAFTNASIEQLKLQGRKSTQDGSLWSKGKSPVPIRNHLGEIVGTVEPDGVARSRDGTILGELQQDGSIVGRDGKLVGQADAELLAQLAEMSEVTQRLVEVLVEIAPATVSGDGSVVNKAGTKIGLMEIPSAEIVPADPTEMVAMVLSEGLVVSKKGSIWGRMSEDGRIMDKNGHEKGSVSQATAVKTFAGNAARSKIQSEIATQCDPHEEASSLPEANPASAVEASTDKSAMNEEELAEAEMWLQRVRSVQQRWSALHSAVKAAMARPGNSKLTQEHIRQTHMKDMQELYNMRVQLQSRMATKDCEAYLFELRNYRRPPRMAAMVMCSVMILLDEPSLYQWRDESLLGIKFPTHQNTISQIWLTMQQSMVELRARLQSVRSDRSDSTTMRNCKAAEQIIEQVTDDQARRASQVVALLRTWVMVLLEVHRATLKFEAELQRLSTGNSTGGLPDLSQMRPMSRSSSYSAPGQHRSSENYGPFPKAPSTAPSLH